MDRTDTTAKRNILREAPIIPFTHQRQSNTTCLLIRRREGLGNPSAKGVRGHSGSTRRNLLSWMNVLMLLTGVTLLAILPDVWAEDLKAPNEISTFRISNSPSANNTYALGDAINVEITWNQNVQVKKGTPQVALTIGSKTRQAGYQSGSGTTTLLFSYTVAATDRSVGIVIPSGGINLNGALITNADDTTAPLTLPQLESNRWSYDVDGIKPTVSSVAFTSTGPYKIGSVIQVTATMSEKVTFTNTPTLTIVIGTTDKTASYTSGTGTKALVFQYTVANGDGDDTNGVSVKTNSLSGTITDSASNAATLTHTAVADGGSTHQVDATAPTVSSLAFKSTGTYKAKNNIDVTVTMSETVIAPNTSTLTLTVGSADKSASYNSGSGTKQLIFRYTVVDGDNDTDGVSVKANSLSGTIKDSAGNAATLTHTALDGGTSHLVDAVAPRLNHQGASLVSTGPYGIGDHIEFSVGFSEAVNVTDNPILSGIEVGGTKTHAKYNRGSGTNAPIFRYTVAEGTNDADGVSLIGAYGVNNGTIRDLAGNDLRNRNGAGNIAANSAHRVDGTKPTVSKLAFTSTGPYKAGDNIDVTVTTSETVTVTGKSTSTFSLNPLNLASNPTLTLTIGTTTKIAKYQSGSGTKELLFRYTVAAGDGDDTDGVSVNANSLKGGTIKDSVGNDLTRTHTAADGGNSHKVDTTSPTVSKLAFRSNVEPYGVGEEIEIFVTMSETVTVTGTPTLTLIIGAAEKAASYIDGSTTNTLIFHYQVAAGDNDPDGVSVKANSLSGGTIKDGAGNDLTRTHTAADAGVEHWVDTTPPKVSKLAFTSTGPYKIGSTIDVTATMSETVNVTGETKPNLTIVVGTANKTASYNSGTGTKALVFQYTVLDGDGDDTDGVAVKADSLALNGGTITDTVGNAATLTHSRLADAGSTQRVDATRPKINSPAFTSVGPYGSKSVIEVTATMNETVNVTGTPTLTLLFGETGQTQTEKTASYTSGTGTAALVFQYTVAQGDADPDGVAVKADSLSGGTIIDSIGNAVAATPKHSGLANGGVGHSVNTALLKVNSVAFTSTGPYKVGSHIEVTVAITKAVTVTGSPTIGVIIGNTTKTASYNRRSMPNKLVFRYTVVDGDGDDTDGVSVTANSLALNGGSILDIATSTAINLNHDAVDGGVGHQVNSTMPQVSSVAFTSTGPYKVGSTVDVTVTMSETVTVTGTPNLTIVIGSANKTASYNSGTGTKALLFQYTVARGDSNDTDGVSVTANSLALNGGTITDSVGNATTRTHTAVDGGTNHRVDTTPPTVSSVAFTSTGPYKVGSIVNVTVIMSEPATVTDTPTLTLVVGSTDKTASYNSGTGTNTLVFRYTIVAGDEEDTDGISVTANSLALNGGTITDSVGNAATLTHTAVDGGADHRVDTTPPTVSALAFSSTGPYGVGSTIDVTATMSETVNVTPTPNLMIVIGSTDRLASYASGTGTKTLVFQYTVAPGDSDDTDGVSVKVGSLSFNGGTIKDSIGNDATLTHSAVDGGTNHRVDATSPKVKSLAFSSTGPYGAGSTIDVKVKMSEPVNVTGEPTLMIVVGNTNKTASYASGSGKKSLVFQYTVVNGDNDTDGVSLTANSLNLNNGTIKDTVGNAATLTHDGISADADHTVDTVPPSLQPLEITSSPATGSFYKLGEVVKVTATMNKPVSVTETPALTLKIGSNDRDASYDRIEENDTELIFAYTIQSDDMDSDGISIAANQITGTVTDKSSNAVELTHSALNDQADHKVDAIKPTVSSISIVSEAGDDDTYMVGNPIQIQVTMSEVVIVRDTPQIALTIGSPPRQADYTGGSSSNTLTFVYTVAVGDNDADGISIGQNALKLNNGTIKDEAGNEATLTHSALAAQPAHKVDTTAPTIIGDPSAGNSQGGAVGLSGPRALLTTVNGVRITSSGGPYQANDAVEITVTFSEPVRFSGTQPELELTIGETEKRAQYKSGDETESLIFEYVVKALDADSDGISIKANSIRNGDSITDIPGNSANLTHPLVPDQSDHNVIGDPVAQAPLEVESLAFTSEGPYGINALIEVTATMSKPVTVTGTPRVTLVIGSTEREARYHSGSGTNMLVFHYTVSSTDGDANGVAVKANSLEGGTIVDAFGNVLSNHASHGELPDAGDQHRVDTTLLQVSGLALTSTGPYGSWDDIEVTLTTTKPVTVTGGPTLKVVIGSTAKTANYYSGSGTNTLAFRYTVAPADGDDQNGVSVRTNSLSLNGGTIVGVLKDNLNLNHPVLPDAGSRHRVDTTSPKVSSIVFTSTGPYSVGSDIEVTLTTDEPVQVTSGATLTLIIGNTERMAISAGSTYTSTLVFRYRVIASDKDDANGVSVKANSLRPNGGTVMDSAGNALDLKHSSVTDGGDSQMVGTTLSSTRSVAFTSTGPYKVGDTIKITAATTEKVNVTGVPRLRLSLGTGIKYANYASGSGSTSLVFEYTVVAGDEDADGIEIPQNALEHYNGSTIKSSNQTDLNLSHAGIAADPTHIVDTTEPGITAVGFATDASTVYTVGDTIEVVVTLKESGVQVKPGANGDMPSVTLLLGSNAISDSRKTEVQAYYKETRPGSTKLIFTYTITADTPVDTDGVQIKPSSLRIPAGASIQDVNGNAIQGSQSADGSLMIAISPSARTNSRPIFPAVAATGIIFNEFLNASNDKHDWVELRNIATSGVSLGGWKLDISTNRSTRVNTYEFPEITLPAGAVMLLMNARHNETRLELSYAYSYRYLIIPKLRLPETDFSLIVRDGTGAVVDVVGDSFGNIETANPTALFQENQAYLREQPDKPGYEASAWQQVGYQAGLGYDRKAPQRTSLGTPGYPKSALTPQNQAETIPVSISEIMYATGKPRSLPQWIELYNASKTDVISLHGWRLQVEGYDPNNTPVHSFVTFHIQKNLQILPNQTVLIITKNGRNSQHFPESRVYNLTEQHPEKLKQTGTEAQVMKDVGFAMVLRDDTGKQVDVIGNLDGENSTRDEPKWKLFNCVTNGGNRLSIIRQFEEGKPLEGTRRTSWFRATDIRHKFSTYYGHQGDVGNPGYKKGGPLPVQLSSFKAERTEAGCVITWQTESELENAGFNVFRSETKNGTFTKVNPRLIPGAGTTSERNTYQYIDTGTKPRNHYYYRLEEVSFAGVHQTLTTQRLKRNISPIGQQLTTLGAIKKQNP